MCLFCSEQAEQHEPVEGKKRDVTKQYIMINTSELAAYQQ